MIFQNSNNGGLLPDVMVDRLLVRLIGFELSTLQHPFPANHLQSLLMKSFQTQERHEPEIITNCPEKRSEKEMGFKID